MDPSAELKPWNRPSPNSIAGCVWLLVRKSGVLRMYPRVV